MEYSKDYLKDKIKDLDILIEKCINGVKLGKIDVETAIDDVNCFVERKMYYVEKLKKLDI